MLVYNTGYCLFQKWCLSDYFHETEVLSASSLPVALEFPSAELCTVIAKGTGKNEVTYRIIPDVIPYTLSCLLFLILALVPLEGNYMQRDEFCFPYFGCALL